MNTKDQIVKLRQTIQRHDQLYHDLDTPEISDQAYDALLFDLEKLEKENPKIANDIKDITSPIYKIGYKVNEKKGFKKVKHNVPQWSFEKAFTYRDLENWEERNMKILGSQNAIRYICELKIDGLKLVLTYKDGSLIGAATRGDGDTGEDVINNAKEIKDIVHDISDEREIVIIGEVWMDKDELVKINIERSKNSKDKLYANVRNLAAGTLRQLDAAIVKERNLKFFAYQIEIMDSDKNLQSQTESLEMIKSLGFKINTEYKNNLTLKDTQKYYEYWNGVVGDIPRRNTMPYGIDGIVIKMDDKKIFDALGYTAKAPRGGIAYKFPPEIVHSTIENIVLQVGRTGAITPVAIMRPVALAGSIVSRATLHNIDEIQRLDVRIGDTVELRKAGDIIPEIFNVIKDLRPDTSAAFNFPTVCPSCHSILKNEIFNKDKNKVSVDIYCLNKSCPAKNVEGMIHFVSRKAMNIEMLGEKIVEEFISLGFITDYASIYKLKSHRDELIQLDGFGEKSIDNILSSIERSRSTELYRLIFALGIRHVGEITSKDIAKNIKNIETLFQMEVSDYLSINGIGTVIADSIYEYMNDEGNIKKIKDLMLFLNIKSEGKKDSGSEIKDKFKNMTFVITGILPSLSREQAKSYIELRAGRVSNSISSKTTYLLAGIEAGSKLDKALVLGIKVIGEEELFML